MIWRDIRNRAQSAAALRSRFPVRSIARQRRWEMNYIETEPSGGCRSSRKRSVGRVIFRLRPHLRRLIRFLCSDDSAASLPGWNDWVSAGRNLIKIIYHPDWWERWLAIRVKYDGTATFPYTYTRVHARTHGLYIIEDHARPFPGYLAVGFMLSSTLHPFPAPSRSIDRGKLIGNMWPLLVRLSPWHLPTDMPRFSDIRARKSRWKGFYWRKWILHRYRWRDWVPGPAGIATMKLYMTATKWTCRERLEISRYNPAFQRKCPSIRQGSSETDFFNSEGSNESHGSSFPGLK